MPLYNIREAKDSEGAAIQFFLHNHWKNNHSLVLSKELLDFQHLNALTGQYNYIVAFNEKTRELDALFGFIPTYQYDKNLHEQGDYWGAIWKKREDIVNEESNEVGMEVFMKIFDYPNFHSFAAIGISKIALKIYKAFQCNIGYLKQYYIFNNSMRDFHIACNVNKTDLTEPVGYISEKGWELHEIDAKDIYELDVKSSYRPRKTKEYIINRYAKHPIYSYRFLTICNNKKNIAILVIRPISVNGGTAIRIVDMIGELKGTLYSSFQKFLREVGAEYIDFLNYGINENVFCKMGFKELDLSGRLIIPNYFEPFEQRNVKIDVAWKADYNTYVAFKGDSDQDRPNIL